MLIRMIETVEVQKYHFYLFYYNLIPIKLINAIPIKPVMIKVIPSPRKGAGTFE